MGHADQQSSRPAVQPPFASKLAALPWSAIAFWTWLAISSVLILHFVLRRVGLSARFGPREPVRDEGILAQVDRLRRTAGVRHAIVVTQAPNLASPVALGRAEIVLPEAALELEADQQLSMLAHEVAHIARRDPMWLLVACLLERVFFFQPLNMVARRRLQESAEFLCDDWATRRAGSGLTLAKCLVKVAEWIDTTPYPVPVSGMAETRSQFVSRIHRLIGNHGLRAEPRRRWLLPFSVAMVGVVVAAAPGARAGQSRKGGKPEGRKEAVWAQAAAIPDSPTASNPASPIEAVADQLGKAPEAAQEAVPAYRPSALPPVPQDTGIVSALVAALKDPDVEVRRAAAQSLGNLRSARAVPGLIAALKDEDVEVRAHVLGALGNLRDVRAFDGMLEALKDPSPVVRAHAAEGVSSLMRESMARARVGQAAALLAGLLSDSSVDVRRHVIQALKNSDRSVPVDAFITALKDPDAEVRAAAAEGLGQAEDPRAVQPLILLSQSDKVADVRHQAVHALGHLKDRRALDAIAAAARDPNADVRQAALEALSGMELTEAPAVLIEALRDENRDIRMQAASTIGEIRDPKAVPALVALLKDADAEIREHAIDALSEIRDAAAINALVAAMQSTDPNVRKRAAEALGERR